MIIFIYIILYDFKFIRSRVGGNRDGCQKICADIPEIELESTLIFESRFESGNLMKAIKVYAAADDDAVFKIK